METTIKRKLQGSIMFKLLERIDLINIRYYRIPALKDPHSYNPSCCYEFEITIRHGIHEMAELLFDNASKIIEIQVPTLVFEEKSDTIRQLPENYIIANFDIKKQHWICLPDLSCDKKLATKVFLELFNRESKYAKNGADIVNKINK